MFSRLKRWLVGVPLNPLLPATRRHLSLITLLAWVGLGADALSSACYGPEEAFLALGPHSHLALYIAAFTVFTIFIISLGYNQVIELFPTGAGGYKVAGKLLHPYAGLVSGVALLVDYILTITVSIVSGTDAIFSFLPLSLAGYKLYVAFLFIVLLLMINLRGRKESIQLLLPIFLGFVILHTIVIIYGITAHAHGLVTAVHTTAMQTQQLAQTVGWVSVIGLTLHAYSLGSGTYTGLEAVSNNVQNLVEPRVQTGKRTMYCMAISLSFMAGGIILLYLLWDAKPIAGQTLNAVVFHSILGDSWFGQSVLVLLLELEAGLLFVAANTGFLDGPNVLANMAVDGWVPNRFRHLSNRLVVQNGLVLFGVAAILILLGTQGRIGILVVLYSINVFITFTLSLSGIAVYWFKHRTIPKWRRHFIIAAFACLLTTLILTITLYYKFTGGGWVTILITSSLVSLCILVKSHYQYIAKRIAQMDQILPQPLEATPLAPLMINPKEPTAILFVNNLSVGMHTLLSVLRLFPSQFKNFVFISVGVVDAGSFRADEEMVLMRSTVESQLDYFIKFCLQNGYPAESYAAFGTDTILELEQLIDKVIMQYPNAIFFANQLIFANDNMITRFLHNQTPFILQHYLHFKGKELVIVPMKI